MKNWFAALILVVFCLVTTHTTLAAEKEFHGYVVGSVSLLVSTDYSLNGAFRVGAGVDLNERFGVELFWDFTGIEPTDLIQKANLPQTIAPLKYELHSYSYNYLTALVVGTVPLRDPFSLVGKVGLARHSQSIEFDALTFGEAIFAKGVKVDDSEYLPVFSIGFALNSRRFEKLSLEFSLTNYSGESSSTGLFTAQAKFSF